MKTTTKGWTSVGVIVAIVTLLFTFFQPSTQERNTASNSGTNNGLIAGKVELNSHFNSTQTIDTLSPVFDDGVIIRKSNDVLNLDNSGILKLLQRSPLWEGAQNPELVLTILNSNQDSSGKAFLYAHKDVYAFDTLENRSQKITVGSRIFIVTLLETQALDESFNYRYTFGIVESF